MDNELPESRESPEERTTAAALTGSRASTTVASETVSKRPAEKVTESREPSDDTSSQSLPLPHKAEVVAATTDSKGRTAVPSPLSQAVARRGAQRPIPVRPSAQTANSQHVLVIPLDDRITAEMAARKFTRYGRIERVSLMRGSSAFIVSFATLTQAQSCLTSLHSHEKVTVRPATEEDFTMVIEGPTQQRMDGGSVAPKSALDCELENERRRAMCRRQERSGLMFEQKQLMQLVSESDEAETRKRQSRHQLMAARIESMDATADELHSYLDTSITLQKSCAETMHKQLHTFASTESGTVRQAAVAISSLEQNGFEQFEDMHKRVSVAVLDSCAKFRERLQQQHKYFSKTGGKVTNSVKDSRELYQKRWQKYESDLTEALEEKSEASQLTSDPFLAGKEFEYSQRVYKQRQTEYNLEMSRLFRELVLADGRRIDSMKSILLDYYLSEKAKAVNRVRMLEAAIEYIKQMDREKDVKEFVQRGEFLLTDATAAAKRKGETAAAATGSGKAKRAAAAVGGADDMDSMKNVFDTGIALFSEKSRQISASIYRDVIKWGILQRPGRIIASNWKPVFAVITKFGFFHAFESKEELRPYVSVPLHNVESELTKEVIGSKDCYKLMISVPNTSWLSLTGAPTKLGFRIDSFELGKEWLLTLRRFNIDKSMRQKGIVSSILSRKKSPQPVAARKASKSTSPS